MSRPPSVPQGWRTRLLSWCLSILATLAIVGTVATMSTNGSGGDGRAARGDSPLSDTGAPDTAAEMRAGTPSPAPFTTGMPRAVQTPTPAMRQADALQAIAGWLEALTYAVLALVAVAAVGVVALVRIAGRPEDGARSDR